MTENEYLLGYLGQEAVEVAHRVSKAMFFGLEETQPGHTKTNEERLRDELCDLYATVEALEAKGLIRPITPQEKDDAIQAKRLKMSKFMDYSRTLGRLT